MDMLEDVRILDLTHVWFGPFCTMTLGSMGAEVIKVEPPWGDMMRMFPPFVKGHNPTFVYLNRTKKGITLNLKSEKGRKVFLDLVKVSDVVVENFMPGTMKKLGLDYEALKEVNPNIIYAALSGYGQYGPYAYRPSFDIIGQAMSGIMFYTGFNRDPKGPPILIAEGIGDLVPALWAVIGILGAIHYKKITGRGQFIDVSQVDTMLAMVPSSVNLAATGMTPEELQKSLSTTFTGVYGIFKARDGYVVVGAPMGGILDRLAKIVGVEKIESNKPFEDWAVTKTVEEAVSALVEGDVPVAPVLSPDKAFLDPHVLARRMVVEVDHPVSDAIKMPDFPLKLSETPARIPRTAPLLGQHTEEVLTSLLGYSKEEVETLRKERAF